MKWSKRLAAVMVAAVVVLWGQVAWSAPKPPVADCLELRWSSVQYGKNVTISNPQVASQSPASRVSEHLMLNCEVEISDPNRIVGVSSSATITLLSDSQGQSLATSPASSRAVQQYEGLRYKQDLVRPEPVPRWQQVMRSVLRIQPPAPTGPQLVDILQPNTLSLVLDTAMLASAGPEISRIEGCYHALSVDALEYVDIPFEPNNTWVRLTPNQEVRVIEAVATPSSYRFRIEANDQAPMTSFSLRPGDPLPSRFVLDRQLLDPDGKPRNRSQMRGSLRAPLGGSGSGSGGNGPIKTIRYVIAVNLTDNQVPFTLEHIPLPKP